ncbi:hypothetical protein [Mucilaginibacter flavus]|uniref:hypothetical protein n=1 Tax=Mucilaginibacter flavus TaxID=931504 RepID=UPI0025B4C6AE|nr:hypothetical protein [Mucilaginibacter flavus]
MNKFLRILQLFDTDQTTYFKIHFHAFQHSQYVVLVSEINRIIRQYRNGTLSARDKKPTINNLIAYLAFFNSGNREMKKFAIKSTMALHPLITIKLAKRPEMNSPEIQALIRQIKYP